MKKILGLCFVLLAAVSQNKAEAAPKVILLSTGTLTNVAELFPEAGVSANSLSANSTRTLDKPIEVNIRVKGIGRYKARYSKQKFFKGQDKRQALLQGEVVTLSGVKGISGAGSASVFKDSDNKYFLTISSLSSARKKSRWEGMLTVYAEAELIDNKFVVKKISTEKTHPRSADKLRCGTKEAASSSKSSSGIPEVGAKATVKIITVLLEADEEYADVLATEEINDGERRGTISTVGAESLNWSDVRYQRDLGLSLQGSVPTSTSTYFEPIAFEPGVGVFIHNEMVERYPAESRVEDIHYLLSGKPSDQESLGDLAGIARNIGAVCAIPGDSVALTIRINNSEDNITMAHEMGHLVGGYHDDDHTTAKNPGIMNAGKNEITGVINGFSAYSKDEIGTFINENSSCLDLGEGTIPGTLPATAKLLAYKDGKFLVAQLYDRADDSGFASIPVSVLYKKTNKNAFQVVKNVTTDENGDAFFKPRKTGIYQFSAEGLTSKKLAFKK